MTLKAKKSSALLLTYNQQSYVSEALSSLINQDHDDLEIIVSDDASTDKTWQIVNAIAKDYSGPKKIILNKNSENLGILGNYFKAFEISTGELIFTAAGDDISLPDRCSKTIARWVSLDGKPDIIATNGFDMDLDGTILGEKATDDLSQWNFSRWVAKRPFIFGASHMMTRKLIGLRNLNSALPYEDQNFTARAFLMGGASTLPIPLVKHRRGGISQTKEVWNFAAKKTRLIRSAKAALLEREDILLDAALLGLTGIEEQLSKQFTLNSYIVELLQEEGFLRQLEISRKYKSVSARKHGKYLGFLIREKISHILRPLT